ncbi:MAG: hypothetical protein AB1344_02315 [Pseudomonadota bacterium]
MTETFDKHTPWRIVHAAIAALLTLKSIIVGTLMLTLGIAVE